ncbi:MAG: hypothetical protein O7E52_23905 [Candidatus Poribacteria bacterium]|nr:hypothetical protein [Candidatus Poribacteria bacterium]
MRSQHQLVLILCIFLIGLLFSSPAQGFIEREYTIHEIIDACTNIVFGKVKSADAGRLRGIVEVKEDVKGKSNLDEIKINFAMGHYRRETSPPKMVGLLKVGMPIIIFYRETYGIQSLGYVNHTWFQTRAYGGHPGEWWGFTHMDPYMSRTFSGETTEFQQIIRAILAGEKWVGAPKNAVKALVLTGNSTRPMLSQVPVYTNTVGYEYNGLKSVRKAGNRVLAYESTRDASLPDLDQADILWLGQGEIANQRYRLNKSTERKIRKFVKNGGIVIVSGQNSDHDRPCETGWLVGKLTGVERPYTQNFEVTKSGTKLFSEPNHIQPGQLLIDDAWTNWDKSYEILATTNGGKDLVVGLREHGKGLYIITSMRNDNQDTVAINKKLMENILYYAANRLR